MISALTTFADDCGRILWYRDESVRREKKKKRTYSEPSDCNATTAAELGITTGWPLQPDVGERARAATPPPPETQVRVQTVHARARVLACTASERTDTRPARTRNDDDDHHHHHHHPTHMTNKNRHISPTKIVNYSKNQLYIYTYTYTSRGCNVPIPERPLYIGNGTRRSYTSGKIEWKNEK